MYKAIHTQTGEEIIILHPLWLKRIDHLREMDRADCLVCQGCRQPLRVKAGEVKRPHFAHKHLQACSYGSESPEILNARAVLYGWLHRRFGDRVTVEKQIEGLGLPRPIDCWVETSNGPIAYWIIAAGIKLEPRTAILAAFERLAVKVHYVFLHAMLNEEKKEFHSLLLTPTERAFLQTTPFDEALAGASEAGQSLHYLDADRAALTTYRALTLHHRPNWYKGVKKTAELGAARIGPDGEFIHPGETERLIAFRQKQARLEKKRQQFAEREAGWAQRLETQKPTRPAEAWGVGASSDHLPEQGQGPEALPCATCGQITLDYWSTFFDERGRKLCRCRECLARGV